MMSTSARCAACMRTGDHDATAVSIGSSNDDNEHSLIRAFASSRSRDLLPAVARLSVHSLQRLGAHVTMALPITD